MLPKVTYIDHYVRSRTWIAPTFAREQIDKRGGKGTENCELTLLCQPFRDCLTLGFRYLHPGGDRDIQE
jgi:hypothetical protein